MGQLKRMMEEIDDAQSEVEGIGISAGWLQRCERHDEVFLSDSHERGHAYALANWRVKHNTTFTSAEVLREALNVLETNVGYECSWCRRDADRDD